MFFFTYIISLCSLRDRILYSFIRFNYGRVKRTKKTCKLQNEKLHQHREMKLSNSLSLAYAQTTRKSHHEQL